MGNFRKVLQETKDVVAPIFCPEVVRLQMIYLLCPLEQGDKGTQKGSFLYLNKLQQKEGEVDLLIQNVWQIMVVTLGPWRCG